MNSLEQNMARDLSAIRQLNPLVHNITNYVVMQPTANALLAIGASPVMAHAIDEVAEMVQIASSLVINIGTLDKNWIESMHAAAAAAKKRNIPIILDPVGAGATSLRTKTAVELIEKFQPSVIRGNAGEIMAVAGETINSKGVDSIYSSDAAEKAAQSLAKQFNCVVVVSGATDLIVDSKQQRQLKNGHPLMAKVTGIGCTASALLGAFCAVNQDYFSAAVSTMWVMGIAGEMAAQNAKGPGSFQVNFIDALHSLTPESIREQTNAA